MMKACRRKRFLLTGFFYFMILAWPENTRSLLLILRQLLRAKIDEILFWESHIE